MRRPPAALPGRGAAVGSAKQSVCEVLDGGGRARSAYWWRGEECSGSYALRWLTIAHPGGGSGGGGGVATVLLDNAPKLNPLRRGMLWELVACVEHLQRDDAVRAVVWGATGRAFCAGADFVETAEAHTGPKQPEVPLPVECQDWLLARGKGLLPHDIVLKGLVLALWDLTKPSVCAVQGLCIGGGVNIATLLHEHCVAGESARFRYPFVELGITPELSCSLQLPFRVGMSRAKRLLLLGEWVDAREALRIGLVDEVVPDAELLDTARRLAARYAAQPASAVQAGKASVNARFRGALERALDAEQEAIHRSMSTPQFRRAMAAFASKHGSAKTATAKL